MGIECIGTLLTRPVFAHRTSHSHLRTSSNYFSSNVCAFEHQRTTLALTMVQSWLRAHSLELPHREEAVHVDETQSSIWCGVLLPMSVFSIGYKSRAVARWRTEGSVRRLLGQPTKDSCLAG